MSLKKLLGVITIVVAVMFGLMLTTSYAWYSYEEGSTTFDAVTNNDNIFVSFQRGEYISTNIAVPIKSVDVDKYSEKNNFIVRVNNNKEGNEIAVTISLVDIVIDDALQNSNFKVELYHYNKKIADVAGDTIGTNGDTTKKLGTTILEEQLDNNFELRVYILDNDADQSNLMNKTFQAKIQVDVVSRLSTTMNDYSSPDIYVSSITIDEQFTDYLPTDGYYMMSATCTKGSTLTWEPLSKTITYASGAKVNDECSLVFTSSTNYPLLNTVEPGSYVQYVGANGCDGKHCEGDNANYVSDTNMGYCYSVNYKFTTNGWRVAYIKDSTAYLVSAGAPECVVTYMDSLSTSVGGTALSVNYYYGSDYIFDESTGKFSLTGVTSSALAWSSNYNSIIANTPYTCKSDSSTGTCTTLYEITGYLDADNAQVYEHYNYDSSYGAPYHLAKLNSKAMKYCNKNYAYGGVCNEDSTWAMNATDFKNIIGSTLSSSSCNFKYSDVSCGYNNDLIDNGGYYWFATPYNSSSSNEIFYWYPDNRRVHSGMLELEVGVRPILRLDSSIKVIGGSGTYNDPYKIEI